MDPERIPVVVATGQCESRAFELTPLELAERAAREALAAAPGLAAALERITMVNVLARRAGPRPASDLAKALGIPEVSCETTSVGGNTPQAMVARAADDIARGRLAATMIVGAEAVRSGRIRAPRAAPAQPHPDVVPPPAQPHRTMAPPPAHARADVPAPPPAEPDRTPPARTPAPPALIVADPDPDPDPEPDPDPVVGTDRQDLSDEERLAGLLIPLHVYPLFESVLASRAGRSPEQQRAFLGRLLAPFTEVAASNPHAWFRDARSPGELSTVTPDNRLVVEPYLKRMVSFLGGAQGAAIVVTSLAVARQHGLDDGPMFVWSAASASDVWYPVARPDLGRAPALELAGRAALDAAGVGIDDVGLIDLYSCFPSAVQIAAASLGLSLDEPGRLTVTGGLPDFGGPGNNYTTHAIACLHDRLRTAADRTVGLVTAVGWYMTKHAVGLYGSYPPSSPYRTGDTSAGQRAIDRSAHDRVASATKLRTTGTVEASTVVYSRDGAPTAAPAIVSLDDGRRAAAVATPGELAHIAGRFMVGSRVAVETLASAPASPEYRVIEETEHENRSGP